MKAAKIPVGVPLRRKSETNLVRADNLRYRRLTLLNDAPLGVTPEFSFDAWFVPAPDGRWVKLHRPHTDPVTGEARTATVFVTAASIEGEAR